MKRETTVSRKLRVKFTVYYIDDDSLQVGTGELRKKTRTVGLKVDGQGH